MFLLWQNPQHRNDFRQVLLDTYLGYSKHLFTERVNYKGYIQDLGTPVLNEDFETYGANLKNSKKQNKGDKAKEVKLAEDEFVRSEYFRREVLRLYDQACCISKLQVKTSTPHVISMVDACHIEPFAKQGNNSIQNGITLTPTLHRAFDRGLIAIDDNYKVVVAHNFAENRSSRYNLGDFARQQILLPANEQYYPSLEALKEHRVRFGV